MNMDKSSVCAKIAEAGVFSTGFLNTASLKGRSAMSETHSSIGKPHANTIDITGLKVKRWTVIGFESRAIGGSLWRCRCECGTERIYRSQHIRKGNMSNGCGCVRETRPYAVKHGLTRDNKAILSMWSSMNRRCHNPLDPGYRNYGGRGISVCEAWRTDAKAFADHMGLPPDSGKYQLDRIDNDGNYEPGNVRWATKTENCRNMRTNLMVDWAGERIPLITACERVGIPVNRVRSRIARGKTPEEAIAAGIRVIGLKSHRRFADEQVRDIRRLKDGGLSYSQLRKLFGCTNNVLHLIVNRVTYKDVR
jgi:hypothetical protein